MANRILNTKVSGVTFEGRQALIQRIRITDPCRLQPEPTNKYDPNAIGVMVAHDGEVWHIGYVPKEVAANIARYLEGETLMCSIDEITGGFELSDGEGYAALGVRLRIELANFDESVPGHLNQHQWGD